MVTLSITQLEKSYGSYTVLKFDRLDINEGIYWIKGGNGTGKTTLFKLIAGQLPFKGNISITGIAMRKEPVGYRAMLSYAEAEPQYPGFITGTELLDHYIKVRNATREQADLLTQQFEMTAFMGNKIESYSSGMLKKLSLICAFTGEAQLYLLDEPLITIDTAAAAILYQQIETLRRKGCIVLLSSHQEVDQREVTLSGTFIIRDNTPQPC